jgi:hypothetical protein
LDECAQCQKPVGDIYFTERLRAEALEPGSEFYNFQPDFKAASSNESLGCTIHLLGVIGVF